MVRKQPPPSSPSPCAICGDRSSGVNFNVVSCESCKAFFRRNALKPTLPDCKSGTGPCPVTVERRRFCRACRLRKCFTLGMKSEWILSTADKGAYRNGRIRAKLQQIEDQESHTRVQKAPKVQENRAQENQKAPFKPDLSFLQFCLTNQSFGDISLQSASTGIPELAPLPIGRLLEPEIRLLGELSRACAVLNNSYTRIREYEKEYLPIASTPIAPFLVERGVRMCSQLHAFTGLPEADQRLTWRQSAIDVFTMRTVLLYDQDRDSWCLMDDKNKVGVMAPLRLLVPFYQGDTLARQKSLPARFRDEWIRDAHIFNILTAIVVFTPSEGHQEGERIRREQSRYCRLLSRYLSSKYLSPDEAEGAYWALLGAIDEIRQLTVGLWKMLHHYRDSFRLCCPLLFTLLDTQR